VLVSTSWTCSDLPCPTCCFPVAAKEIERLQKQQAKLEKEASALQGRLSNKKFMDKAPEKVVAEVKQQAAEMAEQLSMIQEKITKFGGLA
jgi:valyl-tRNA synthetase